jgi:hypothetical protein
LKETKKKKSRGKEKEIKKKVKLEYGINSVERKII